MGKIICISQAKGGACKTTTALNLTGALIELGHKVLLFDADYQKPDASAVANQSGSKLDFVYTCKNVKNPYKEIMELKEKYDYVVCDTSPNYIDLALKCVMLSDFVILPSKPGYFDEINLEESISVPVCANKRYKLLACDVDIRTNLGKDFISNLKETGYAYDTFISSKIAMRECGYYGQWIGEYAPKMDNHKEFLRLANEVIADT
jgi:chromosome partitioning protein